MAKFPEAHQRLFANKFVCQNCKRAIKAPSIDVIARKISCRGCSSKNLRVYRKK